MKICILSYEYAPFPGGGIATYNNAAAKILAASGHEVHVVTNAARHGSRDPSCTHRRWQDGNLHIHRIHFFDDKREVPHNAQFFDVDPNRYSDPSGVWAREPSNQAAHKAVSYIEALHKEVGLDVIESPEFFAEAFYVIRRRASGERHRFPPVCAHGHISSRIAFGTNQHSWELGWYPHRQMMLREEYCVQHADALLTPSRALMHKYVELFGDALPDVRATIPYFLELPDAQDQLPNGLDADKPFMVCVGRIEPRKGSDLAMRAFTSIADDYPELDLVFLGKPMWHQGESIEEVVAANVAPRHRSRIVRLGNVPRAEAVAAVRAAKAFLHPAPWDNYPCATLEALGMGAMCIVSDQGGQSEMVEHEASGLVFPANDAESMATAMRRVLDDPAFAERMRQGATARIADITHPERLLEQKIALFDEMIAREKSAAAGGPGVFDLPPTLRVGDPVDPLPGRGLVILDAAEADAKGVQTTIASLEVEVGSSPDWDLAVFARPDQELEIPRSWTRFSSVDRLPWLDRPDGEPIVWTAAGVRLDKGRLQSVVRQVLDARVECGSFLWLRPRDARAFPFPPDASWQDMLVGGRGLPQIFAARSEHFRSCKYLSGMMRQEHRLATLPAAISAAHGIMFQHTGILAGDYYGDLPIVDAETQWRAMGYLDSLGIAPRQLTVIGNLPMPVAPTADVENLVREARQQGRQEGLAEGRKNGRPKQAEPPSPAPQKPAAQAPAGTVRVDPAHLAELEKVHAEHTALKNSKPARLLRKLGIFTTLRRIYPKSRGALGSGRSGG